MCALKRGNGMSNNNFKYKQIPLKQIKMEENTRIEIEKLSLHELISSIKQNGVIQPAGVYKKGNYYFLIWGNRRHRASKLAGMQELPCMVVPQGTNEKDFLIMNLTENMQRKEVSPHEQGRGFKELRDKHKMTSKEIAAKLGVSDGTVIRNLNLYERLPKTLVKDLVPFKGRQADKGKIAPMVATKIITIAKAKKLSKSKQELLYKFGKSGSANPEKISQVSKLMENGVTIKSAINKVTKAQPINFGFAMNRLALGKLVKKYKKTPEDIIRDKLRKDPEIKKCLII
jgi:ParB/RepB/Spo0J family partition protein